MDSKELVQRSNNWNPSDDARVSRVAAALRQEWTRLALCGFDLGTAADDLARAAIKAIEGEAP